MNTEPYQCHRLESRKAESEIRSTTDKDLHARLSDYRRYQRQIERLHKKHLLTRLLYVLQQDDVSLASMILNARRVGKLTARTIKRGQYQFQPGRVREIKVEGKTRQVFSYDLLDLIVHNTVADIIEEAMLPFLSSGLYSYRKNVSWWTPVSKFASYIREYRRSHPDVKTRGIYILRRDIHAYTDTIPVGENSRVWHMLRELLMSLGPASSISQADWQLVQNVVRPEVWEIGGGLACRILGVPTGQSISCVLFNLYLSELDHELYQVPGAFYARYSDDIMFAHSDANVVKEVDRRIDYILSDLDLNANPDKSQNLYLTAAGLPSPEWHESQGASSVQLLGARISADGTISLNRKKTRRLLRDVETRALRTATLLQGEDWERVGRIVCSVINRVLDPNAAPYQQLSACLLRFAVTDRTQLAQLDYWIARIVLRAVTGKTRVHAFREIPYRKIRQDWGLVSLLHARNRRS